MLKKIFHSKTLYGRDTDSVLGVLCKQIQRNSKHCEHLILSRYLNIHFI